MRWHRFVISGLIGLCLTIGWACQAVQPQNSASLPSPSEISPSEISPSEISPSVINSNLSSRPTVATLATPLPPVTEAIVQQFPHLANPPRGDVRLALISDLNSAYGSTDYEPEVDRGVNLLPFWQPDLVLCSGDMVAGQKPSLTPDQIRAMWDAFDQHVAAPLRQFQLPFGFTIGNHDASGSTAINGGFLFQQERDLATQYWHAQTHHPGIQFVDRFEFPFYYTFQHQDIFFLAWDGSSSRIPSDKLNWVERALASPAAQQAKLRILLSHLPLYGVAVGRDEPGEVMDNADELRSLLEKYNVHTYISGHHHAYYPGHKGEIQLLHAGILGSGPRPLIAGDQPPRKTLTLIDVDFNSPELTRYTTYDMQTLQVIEMAELPRFLAGHNGTVYRRDIDSVQ
ncbi:MAG: metallophosphoesterase [Elainella sp. Prado103]|jgi:hypothetical protein|nr:metallophosphoesterase [Elainella sp. Prado103]